MRVFQLKPVFLVLLIFISLSVFSQNLKISEIMSVNLQTIADEDGEYSDWIEIYNDGNETIELQNFFLSDKKDNPYKWQFPEEKLKPGKTKLIFASGKNRKNIFTHWYSVFQVGDSCKYIVPNANTPANWHTTEFNDSTWKKGKTGIGYGDRDDSTFVPLHTRSVFLRYEFNIEDVQSIHEAWFHMDYDDGFIAFINGKEIARSNMGEESGPANYNALATQDNEAVLYKLQIPEGINLKDTLSVFKNGKNVLAVQVHNSAVNSSDLSCIPFLTLGLNTENAAFAEQSALFNFKSKFPHTNFKLSGSGETVLLSHANNGVTDSVSFEIIPYNHSFGRAFGNGEWGFLFPATPAEVNGGEIKKSQVDSEISFSITNLFLTAPQLLQLSKSGNTGTIRYTTNGNEPGYTSPVYENSIPIEKNTVVKARVFEADKVPGKIFSRTYIFDNPPALPVVCISADSSDLWDNINGIYVLGNEYELEMPHHGANYWEDWEKPATFEYVNKAGTRITNNNCGIKIFGGWSRTQPQKSLSIFFRDVYGNNKINNLAFFENKPIFKFKSLVLRNSGNDYGFSRFRDAMMTSLVRNLDIDYSANQPVIMYLNGEYWGHINLREKINEDFIESNHGIDSDKLDLLQWNGSVIEGSSEEYWKLIDYLNTADMKTDSAFEKIQTKIDLSNYFDYQLSQIYFDNKDWPGNNIKYWRPQTENGKWRWIMFDTDFGFSIYNPESYNFNTLEFALATDGPNWPNPPWSTLIFRKLLENQKLRNEFINRFADVLNTTFLPENVIPHIDSMKNNLEPEMNNHVKRWESPNYYWWLTNVDRMNTFASKRPEFMRQFIQQEFNLPEQHELRLAMLPTIGGSAKLNSLHIKNSNWNGIYFQEVPVTITAVPNPGFTFNSFIVDGQQFFEPTIQISLEKNTQVRILFEDANNDGNSVVINEINYKSADNFDAGDWIEIYNWGRFDLDISGWILKDDDDEHAFVFPENTMLKSNDYLVICRNLADFKTIYSNVNCLGEFDFGLSSTSDRVRLFDQFENLVDEVSYNSVAPWPDNVSGTGFTLELRQYFYDNAQSEFWNASSSILGTPGFENSATTFTPVFTENNKQHIRVYPNPSTEKTIINFQHYTETDPWQIEMYSINGDLIFSDNCNTTEYIWNGNNYRLQKVKPGIYFCKVIFRNKSFVAKVIRQ